MGKNTVAQIALGRTPEDEFKDNLRHVSEVSLSVRLDFCTIDLLCHYRYCTAQKLEGDIGIIFTSRGHKEVMK
jgi:ribosomal protein L10